MSTLRVLIAGKDAPALYLAALLAYRGFTNVLLVDGGPIPASKAPEEHASEGERPPSRPPPSHPIEVYPALFRLLRGIGVTPKDLPSSPLHALHLHIAPANTVATFALSSTDEAGEGGAGPASSPIQVVDNARLVSLLRRRCQELGVQYQAEVSLKKLSQFDEHAEITLTNGAVGCFDVVVAADSLDSFIGPAHPPVFYDTRRFSCFIRSPSPPPVEDATVKVIRHTDGRMVQIFSAPTTQHPFRVGVSFYTPVDMPNRREEDARDALLSHFSDLGREVRSLVEKIEDPSGMAIEDMLEMEGGHRVVDGRVVWLGEAADAMLPSLGLNVGWGMESAACLVEELSRCSSAWGDLSHALWLYSTRRATRRQSLLELAHTAGEDAVPSNSSMWNPLSLFASSPTHLPVCPYRYHQMRELAASKW